MKTQIITFGLLLAALSVTSCKNNETVPQETPVTTAAPNLPEAAPTDSTAQTEAKEATKSSEKEEKGENEAIEKNEKE